MNPNNVSKLGLLMNGLAGLPVHPDPTPPMVIPPRPKKKRLPKAELKRRSSQSKRDRKKKGPSHK